ncbi:hypothetical protein C8J56DRAFT_1005112 [Mycena floridula]|nr:hypothetical protein C8J56DRAFT_1005112 [Mycena floridula]
MDGALDSLQQKGISFCDLMFYVFDLVNKKGNIRWDGFFKQRNSATGILNHWVSLQNSETTQNEVHDWAIGYVGTEAKAEACRITASGFLQMMNRVIDTNLIKKLSMSLLFSYLCDKAPTMLSVTTAFTTLTILGLSGLKDKARISCEKSQVITSSLLQCIGTYNCSNNLFKHIFGLYLYATGSQWQAITVISHLGLSESYNRVVGKKQLWKKKKKKKSSGPAVSVPEGVSVENIAAEMAEKTMTKGGSLRQLSDSMRQTYRTVASTRIFAGVYDNINWVSKISKQVVGHTDSLESARLEHLQLKEFEKAFVNVAPLEITDILHTTDEAHLFEQCLIHTILHIILQKFKDELDKAQLKSDTIIEVHKTPIHPVTAFNIDEATIVVNAEFAEEFYSELNVTKQALFNTWVKLLGGDQLSIVRLRALLNIRIGHEGGFSSFGWGAWMPGLLHGKIADTHGFLVTHWGKPNCGARNPGSLWFHNTTLHRLPIVLTSLPTFQICCDLTFVSLYSRVLHCLLRVSGMKSLTQYVTEIKSFRQLEQHATQIYTEFADSKKVDELRWQRCQSNAVPPIAGDMVFENAILFLRDALITQEFADAVKAGDSETLDRCFLPLPLPLVNPSQTKYAYEMLHIIHNLTHVWPKELADNWVVNPTGCFNCFIEIDLMQEHNNFWIKTFYKAHRSGASWEWLEMILPCVTVLCQLSNTMQDLLGSYQGTTHKPADLRDDINLLMTSLQEHNVYEVQSGQLLEGGTYLLNAMEGYRFEVTV